MKVLKRATRKAFLKAAGADPHMSTDKAVAAVVAGDLPMPEGWTIPEWRVLKHMAPPTGKPIALDPPVVEEVVTEVAAEKPKPTRKFAPGAHANAIGRLVDGEGKFMREHIRIARVDDGWMLIRTDAHMNAECLLFPTWDEAVAATA